MSEEDCPFDRVYDAVYSLLFDSDGNLLSKIIDRGNRISFGAENNENRSPLKDKHMTADFPEVMLIDEGGLINPHINSSGAKYDMQLGLYVSTGDFRYKRYVSKINWYILCNLMRWQTVLTAQTTWKGSPIVKSWDMTPVQIGLTDPNNGARAHSGWVSIWRIALHLYIPNAHFTYLETE